MPAVLNAANEVGVEAFLSGSIRLPEIAETNRRVTVMHRVQEASSVAAVLDADRWARKTAGEVLATFSAVGAPGAVAALTGAEAAI